ncbi:hypothetical protein HK096_000450, partial [Nowakowskiella sp. JEL0078]
MNLEFGDVTFSLTDRQYALVTEILKLGGQRKAHSQQLTQQPQPQQITLPSTSETTTNTPEPKKNTGKSDLTIVIPNIVLELLTEDSNLYDFSATTDPTDTTTSLARFSIQRAHLNHFVDVTGNSELEIQVGAFGLLDTRPATTNRFRDAIVPGANAGDRDMLLVHLSASAGKSKVVVTLDTSRVYLVLDYIHDLQDFAVKPFRIVTEDTGATMGYMSSEDESEDAVDEEPTVPWRPEEDDEEVVQINEFGYRVNLVDLEVVVLQDASSPQSEAIVMAMRQLVVAYDKVMTIAAHEVGMFFCVMSDDERLRFIEDFNVTATIDQRLVGPGHRISNVVVDFSEVMVRASYHDIELVLDILNKASLLMAAPVADQGEMKSLVKKVDEI